MNAGKYDAGRKSHQQIKVLSTSNFSYMLGMSSRSPSRYDLIASTISLTHMQTPVNWVVRVAYKKRKLFSEDASLAPNQFLKVY